MPRFITLSIPHDSSNDATAQAGVPKRNQLKIAPSSRGFTLIELLITVVIISILFSVILCVTGPIVESAHRTACASNLRQWGVAVMSIAADSRGLLPEMGLAQEASTPVAVLKSRRGMKLSNPLLEEYIGFNASGKVDGDNDGGRLAPIYRCPSNPASLNLDHWNGYGFFSMSYSYFGRSDALVSATIIGQESLCVRRLDAQRLLMQDGLYKWWIGPDSWSFNHSENRTPSAAGRPDCWRGLPQITGPVLPANGINQLWGDGRVAWHTLDKALRSDVSNTTFWGVVVAYGLDCSYFPIIATP